MDKKLLEPLTSELLNSLVVDDSQEVGSSEDIYSSVPEIQPYFQVDVPELPDMQVPTGGWRDFVEQLKSSGFSRALADGSDEFLKTELSLNRSERAAAPISELSIGEKRHALEAFANQLIAAENVQGKVPRPLVTQPLSALASRYNSEVPIAISEGAKGTGKTLAARFIVSSEDWSLVVRDLVGMNDAVSARVVPIAASIQSSEAFQREADEARQAASKHFGFEAPLSIYETTTFLKERLQANLPETAWVSIWLDIIAWSLGFKPKAAGAGDELFSALRASNQSIVAIFEGLEELYASVTDPGVEVAMRALLTSLPQKLRSEPRRPVGLLTFVRRDTVEAAIRQNQDQFRREYAPFALTWTEDDVLELAPPEVSALIRHGIIFGEKPPYEVPELFRRGLGLKHSGARRSVVKLYNSARKRS